MVEKILGGEGRPRYSEFNFRETPAGRGKVSAIGLALRNLAPKPR
jgi:hypothetical protein